MTDKLPPEPPEPLPIMVDKPAVAAMLTCSPRHVDRLADSGRMPAPIRLGALVRWRYEEITDWINAGCPAIRQVKAKRGTK